jgi:hypothetical protein
LSLDDVEKSLAQLKDITEARNLRKENQVLREELEKINQDHRREMAGKDLEIMNLHVIVKEYEAHKIKYGNKKYSPKEFHALVLANVDEKVKADIEDKANETWEARAPELTISALKEELKKYPILCMPKTRELIDSLIRTQRDIQLSNRNLWPPWFKQIYNSEVQRGIERGLDAEFHQRVEDTSQGRLNALINFEWPRYINNANRFFRRSLSDQLMMLQSPITLICDRCGTHSKVRLSTKDIANLIKKPMIKFSCITEGCRDFLRPHGIPLTLVEVILQLVKPTIRFKSVGHNNPEGDTNIAVF